jgi:molybdopterin synthase sulfur carrier subunit
MAQIRIPPVLRPDAAGSRTVDVDAGTVREALDNLVALHPALESRVRAGDGVPSYLNVFVDGDDIRLLGGLDTAVSPASLILLLPAVAGGGGQGKAVDFRHMRPAATTKPVFLISVIACARLA